MLSLPIVYRGNGFIITTNNCGEIFLASEKYPMKRYRIGQDRVGNIKIVGLKTINLNFGSITF